MGEVRARIILENQGDLFLAQAGHLDGARVRRLEHGTNQRVVAIGSGIAVSTMSEILAGRRQMNLDHVQKLAGFFKIDAGVFLPRPRQTQPGSKAQLSKKRLNRDHAGRN